VKICVLIVTYQRPELLRNCLGSLERQTRRPDELIVVGVVGDTLTQTVVEEFARTSPFPCVWRFTLTPSVVLQTNLGLDICTADIVVFINDDAEALEDWLERIEPYYGDETVGAVGGRDYIHLSDGSIVQGQARQVGRITWFGRVRGNHHLSYPHIVEVHVLKGVNMSCRRNLLGTLDTRMAGGGRWHWEIDASFQIREKGKRLVFDPGICVNHFPGPRPSTLDPEFVYMANFNLMLNLGKHLQRWRKLVFVVYTFLWGDFPEMGLAIFGRTFLGTLLSGGSLRFATLFEPCLRGKIQALRALAQG